MTTGPAWTYDRIGRRMKACQPIEQRIADRIEPDLNSGCWLWTGALNSHGYGKIWADRRLHRAHRVTYSLFVGEIAPGLVVCHRCDTPACVNPDHLFLGTQADNIRDMNLKGRRTQGRVYAGALNSAAKLTEDQARKVLADVRAGRTKTAVANDNGITRTAVYHIVTGRNWPHLQREAA